MDHRLFVPRLVVRHRPGLVMVELTQRLTDAGDIAVAEDPEGPCDRAHPGIAVDRVLAGQERHQRLRDRHRRHRRSPPSSVVNPSRPGAAAF
ncbi:Uncharacterised protein [Mycobacteroides abscessus subsp. abscessus]|nr:Uncharacterised protein [Mycobacteroides abscessus subsp. abscessus]